MSRSKKKVPIFKDRPRNQKKSSLYWRRVRSRQNQEVRGFNLGSYWNYIFDSDYSECYEDFNGVNLISNEPDFSVTDPRLIVNYYDISDYEFYIDKSKYYRK